MCVCVCVCVPFRHNYGLKTATLKITFMFMGVVVPELLFPADRPAVQIQEVITRLHSNFFRARILVLLHSVSRR